jgi:hypothetical protein
MFPLRFHFLIQKARWLNQERTKVETSARAEAPAEKESGKILPDAREAVCFLRGKRRKRSRRHSKKQHGALTQPKLKAEDRSAF